MKKRDIPFCFWERCITTRINYVSILTCPPYDVKCFLQFHHFNQFPNSFHFDIMQNYQQPTPFQNIYGTGMGFSRVYPPVFCIFKQKWYTKILTPSARKHEAVVCFPPALTIQMECAFSSFLCAILPQFLKHFFRDKPGNGMIRKSSCLSRHIVHPAHFSRRAPSCRPSSPPRSPSFRPPENAPQAVKVPPFSFLLLYCISPPAAAGMNQPGVTGPDPLLFPFCPPQAHEVAPQEIHFLHLYPNIRILFAYLFTFL